MERSVEYQYPRTAAFFDLDKTIIATSSALAFGRPFYRGGLITRRDILRGTYAQLVFRRNGANHMQMERMRRYICELCKGWQVQQVHNIVNETLEELIDPYVYVEAADLIEAHHEAGADVVIVSSSGVELVEPIGSMLGADHVIATRMTIDGGYYTGDIEYYAYGENKAQAIRELAERANYDLANSYAYSDSVTDTPMLEAVGNPRAVNPDRGLRRVATTRGWPILTFTHPVSLYGRLPRRPMIAATVTAGVTVAGLLWYVSRRKIRG